MRAANAHLIERRRLHSVGLRPSARAQCGPMVRMVRRDYTRWVGRVAALRPYSGRGEEASLDQVKSEYRSREGVESSTAHYHRYLAKRAKRQQDASNQLPDMADVSIGVFDEEEPQARHFRRDSCVSAANRSVATGPRTARRAVLSVHVSFGR